MGRRKNYPELTDELLMQIKKELFAELERDITLNIEKLVNGYVYKAIGTLLDFPLTVQQVAVLFGKNPKAVYKMCDRKQIPFTKVGTKVYINLRDINSELILGSKREKSLRPDE